MRLFTALWPPPEAIDALAADVEGVEMGGTDGNGAVPRGWRRTDTATWHITLAFHGEADPGVSARRLERSAHGLPAPRLRLTGAGAFEGIRWAGVEADSSLDELVTTAGGDVAGFIAHVTVLRRRPRPGPDAETDPPVAWAAHRGPWWQPGEVLLVASEPGRGGKRYRVVHRVPLAAGSRRQQDRAW